MMLPLLATITFTVEVNCFPMNDWRPVLAEAGQVETVRALIGPRMKLIFVSPDGHFTSLYVDENMDACLIEAGTNWTMAIPEDMR